MRLEIIKLTAWHIKGIGFGDKPIVLPITPEHITNGPNGVGKTTMLDTIMWLLTGQNDLLNRKFDPEVKNGTEVGDKISYAELIIKVDEIEHRLKIERDVKSKGLKYFFDNQSVKKNEYETKLSDLKLSRMALLSNPYYLLEYLNWSDAREIISELINKPSEDDLDNILKNSYNISEKVINYGKSKSWEKQQMLDEINFIKGSMSSFETNIEYHNNKLQEMTENVERPILEAKRLELINKRKKLENTDEINEKNKIIRDLESKNSDINQQLSKNETMKRNISSDLESISDEISIIDNDIKEKTVKFESEAKKPIVSKCPTCGGNLTGDMLDNVKHIHQENIAKNVKTLEDLETKKNSVKASYFKMQAKLQETYTKEQVLQLKGIVNDNKTIIDINRNEIANSLDTNALSIIDTELIEINKKLSYDTTTIKSEIDKLNSQLKDQKEKMEIIESAIDSVEHRFESVAKEIKLQLSEYFPKVDINLTKKLKNGSIKPTFSVSIKGVEYKDLNTGNKFVAGVTICLGLQKLLGVNVPLLIDNGESFDNFTLKAIAPNSSFIMMRVVNLG